MPSPLAFVKASCASQSGQYKSVGGGSKMGAVPGSHLATPVPAKRVLLAPLVAKAPDVLPLDLRELVSKAFEDLVEAEDVVPAGLPRSSDVHAHDANGLGGEHDVVPCARGSRQFSRFRDRGWWWMGSLPSWLTL